MCSKTPQLVIGEARIQTLYWVTFVPFLMVTPLPPCSLPNSHVTYEPQPKWLLYGSHWSRVRITRFGSIYMYFTFWLLYHTWFLCTSHYIVRNWTKDCVLPIITANAKTSCRPWIWVVRVYWVQQYRESVASFNLCFPEAGRLDSHLLAQSGTRIWTPAI